MEEYRFTKPINRISLQSQIPELFDEPAFCGQRGMYAGKIDGVDAKIAFRTRGTCLLYTKTQKDLDKARRTLMERLLGRD